MGRILTIIIMMLAGVSLGFGESVSNRLEAGALALEDGFAPVAEKTYREILASGEVSKAEREIANRGLLRSLLQQAKYDELLELVSKLEAQNELAKNAATYWRAAVRYHRQQYAAAAKMVSAISTNLPSGVLGEAALRLLAMADLKSGDVGGAIKAFEEFATKYPQSPDIPKVRLEWGKALIFSGKQAEALKVLQPVIESGKMPTAPRAMYWSGKVLIGMGEPKKGISILEKLRLMPGLPLELKVNVTVALIEARHRQGQGKPDAADVDRDIKELQELLADVKDSAGKRRISYELCRIMLNNGRIDEARPLVKAYIAEKADVSAAELQLMLGRALLKSRRYAEAAEVYQHYFEIFDDAEGDARARRGSGWALLGTGRYAEAAQAFEKAYELFENSSDKAECLYKVGDAYLQNGQYQKAIDTYESFLKKFPDSEYGVKALFNIAVSLQNQKKYAEAQTAFEKVFDRFPKSTQGARALMRVGGLLEESGDWKGAEKLYDRVMRHYSDSDVYVQALYGRGVARYRLWKPDAIKDFEVIIDKFPGSTKMQQAVFMRAMCLYRLGRDETALKVCEDFLRENPDSALAPRFRFQIGRFAYNSGDYERAEREFSDFVKRYPKDELADAALFREGMSAFKRKEYVTAIELFGRMVKAYPKSSHIAEARFYQAEAMCELGKFAAAILVYDEVIKGYPESCMILPAWGRKGDCQFTLGAEDKARYEEAVNSYRVVARNAQARKSEVLQAQYKIGRSLEKLGRTDEALQAYYGGVMLPFVQAREHNTPLPESANVWFTRASLAAAEIVEKKQDWRQLIRILNRIVAADVDISADAAKRVKEIESDKWWLFY